jgi:hypothetical protein
LSAKNRRHADAAADEKPKKYRKNHCDTDPAWNATFLQPIRSLGDRESEEHAEEEEEDYGVRDPEQADGDVEAEYERDYSHDFARRDPNLFAGGHAGMLNRPARLREFITSVAFGHFCNFVNSFAGQSGEGVLAGDVLA